MIKDNLGDTNKLYLTLNEVSIFIWTTAKWKVKSFYRIKNKEQKKRKIENNWLAGATQSTCLERERPDLAWRLGIEHTYCVSGQRKYLQGQESLLSFSLLKWYPGQEQLHLGLGKLFQHILTTSKKLNRLNHQIF